MQQNEIFRENQFVNWKPNKTNIVPLLMMVVAFPALVHTMVTDEFAIRDAKKGLTKREVL